MVVAFQKELGYLKKQLQAQGFHTVTYGEYFHQIDALVYIDNLDIKSVTNTINNDVNNHNSLGIFLVNATNKSATDIANILHRKTYSPLF